MESTLQGLVGRNSLVDYLVAAGILAGTLVVFGVARRGWQHWIGSDSRAGVVRRLADAAAPPTFQFLQCLSLYFAFDHLNHRHAATRLLHWYAAICVAVAVARLCTRVASALFEEHWSHQTADRRAMDRQLRGFMPVITILVWGIALIGLMDNLGVRISGVVAGLGIGGVAIALASQAVLADLFAYFAILFDRPFDIEDTIAVDNFTGTVEYIGIKTTRLRSVSGEQVILSNSDLTRSRLRNFRHLKTRRTEFSLPVSYTNSTEKLQQLPELARQLIADQPMAKIESAHLTGVTRNAFRFTVAYQVLSERPEDYLAVQQAILIGLKRLLDEHEIILAFTGGNRPLPYESSTPEPVVRIISGDRATA